MVEFGVLSLVLAFYSKAWSDSLDDDKGDGFIAVLSLLAGLGSFVCMVLAVTTAPWGRIW